MSSGIVEFKLGKGITAAAAGKDESTLRKIKNFGLSFGNLWFEDEENLLRRIYPKLSNAEIMQLLPRHPWSSIEHKASRLAIRKNPPTKMSDLSEAQKGYIAGIIDGEGSVGIQQKSRSKTLQVAVQIASTDSSLVDWVKKITGLGGTCRYVRITAPNHSDAFYYTLSKRGEVFQLLSALQPYLILKTKQVALVLEYIKLRLATGKHWSHYSEREFQIYEELKALNRRGRNV